MLSIGRLNEGFVRIRRGAPFKPVHGIAMTEYIIILGLVAIAAIVIFAFFGKVIRATVSNFIDRLRGVEPQPVDISGREEAGKDYTVTGEEGEGP